MKVTVNSRAAIELIEIMEMLNIKSPAHAVNTLITKFHKHLTVENPPFVEVNINGSERHPQQ